MSYRVYQQPAFIGIATLRFVLALAMIGVALLVHAVQPSVPAQPSTDCRNAVVGCAGLP